MTDTGKAQQPQAHCDHEIVCWMYRENKIPQGNQPCMRNHYGYITCKHDTRIHTSASHQRIEQAIKELMEADETSDFYECCVHVKAAIALLQAGRK